MVAMGVFGSTSETDGEPYVCLDCEATFDVQYYACPSCGAYDVRRAKWLRE